MGTGYTTIMYDPADIGTGLRDIAACRYDGAEIGLGKVRETGPETVGRLLTECDLDLYCVMSDWLETEDAVERVEGAIPMVADLGAEYLGFLPPQRHRRDDATVTQWLARLTDAAMDAGLVPAIHHHGATHVERPDEIREVLDAVENLGLLFDTAHHYPYGEHYPDGDVTDGIERFADDIVYVHLKDVAPPTGFTETRESLTRGDFHLDNVVNYFRSFTDLGDGVIDFEAVREALDEAGYEGHVTVEIENRTEKPLVHAKENYDYWEALDG